MPVHPGSPGQNPEGRSCSSSVVVSLLMQNFLIIDNTLLHLVNDWEFMLH